MPELGGEDISGMTNPLQIAQATLELTRQYAILVRKFSDMAANYATLAIECIEARRKTDEKIDQVIAALDHYGIPLNPVTR